MQETMDDRAEAAYLKWDSPEAPPNSTAVSIHLHRDVVDGLARDVVEGSTALETGGLLLGRLERSAVRPIILAVWIERYKRIPCGHRLGPDFILDDEDKAGLEAIAA